MVNTALQLVSTAKGNPVTFITGLKYGANELKAFNNMTFLYDPNWSYTTGDTTYPFSFFYVKNFKESLTSEISQRPMLFYNSATSNNDSTKGGLLNVVADNIIIKPKVYQMELIIPMDITAFNEQYTWSAENIANISKFLIQKKDGDENLDTTLSGSYTTAFQVARVSLDILKTLFKALYGTELSVSSICNMITNQQDYNRNSIENMWSNRRFLKLKMWNGWKFKCVIITDFEITKSGENGAYYEATMTCQEVPVMTFRPSSNLTKLYAMQKVSEYLSKKLKLASNIFINAMEASYAVKS